MKEVVLFLLVAPQFLVGANAILNRKKGAHPHRTPFVAGKYTNLVFVPLYVWLHVHVFGTATLPLLAGVAFFLIYLNCVVFLNWFIFTLTDVSMHIQLIMQISRLGSVRPEQLVERYNKNSILDNRVPRLLELGQLRLENGRLFVNGSSVLFGASVCMILRRILGIPIRPEDADHSK